jgi:hypothetical protein
MTFDQQRLGDTTLCVVKGRVDCVERRPPFE